MQDIEYKKAVEQAGHFKAIGQKEIYLSCVDVDDELPWEFVTEIKDGGSHRLDICTNIWIIAQHPCGLTFRWSFDIEPLSANGSSGYQIDVASCTKIVSLIPVPIKDKLKHMLADKAARVSEKGLEYQKIAQKQFGDARILLELSRI